MNWNIDPQQIWTDYVLPWGTQIALALLIFIIGRMIAGMITNTAAKGLTRAKLDPILVAFVKTVMGTTLTLLVIVFALSQLGVDTTSLVAGR